MGDAWTYPMETLSRDLHRLLERTPFNHQHQISLTGLNQQQQDPYLFTGSLYDYENSVFLKQEQEFTYFLDIYRDLLFYQIYQDLVAALPFPIGRMRLLKMLPKSCYSMHKDDGFRFHLALQTNPQCFLIFKDAGAFHIPGDGQIYGSNTLLDHSAMNGSFTDRIHLVVSTKWTEEAGQKYAASQSWGTI